MLVEFVNLKLQLFWTRLKVLFGHIHVIICSYGFFHLNMICFLYIHERERLKFRAWPAGGVFMNMEKDGQTVRGLTRAANG